MTFVSWRGGSFLVGKTLINLRISQDHFLIGISLIKVNRGVHDISLYRYSWRLSKATLDPSRSLFPSASFSSASRSV